MTALIRQLTGRFFYSLNSTITWSVYFGWRVSHSCGRNMKKVMNLTLTFWNVRTLLDSTTSTSGRPERRTALGAKELARYRVDIAALSETRLSNKSKVTEIGDGYTIFWNGRSSDERREAGEGLAIKDHLVKKPGPHPLESSPEAPRVRPPP